MKIIFDVKFFEKKDFNKKIISRYFYNALKDIKIASRSKEEEVIFKFSYDAIIKTGITLLASHGFRVRSRRGHHIKILEKLSQILNDEEITLIGESMRRKRNLDLYEGGILISEKEAKSYFNSAIKIVKKGEEYLKSQSSLL